jgi:hypothetical protein
MNKPWMIFLAFLAVALLIYPYLGIGKSAKNEDPEYTSQPVSQAKSRSSDTTDKNNLSDIEDLLKH